jgi:hypothetical protein
VTSQWVQFTKDVIEQEERVDATTLLDQFMTREAQGEGERALLALGRLTSGVSTLE